MEEGLVARPLAIEGEAGAVMADLDQPFAPSIQRIGAAQAARRARRGRSQTAGCSGFSAKAASRSISISS